MTAFTTKYYSLLNSSTIQLNMLGTGEIERLKNKLNSVSTNKETR